MQQRNPVNEQPAHGQRQGLSDDQDQRVGPERVERYKQEQDRREMVAEVGHLVLRIEEQAAVDRLPDDVVHDAEVVEVALTAQVPHARRYAEHKEVDKYEQPDGPWFLRSSRILSRSW